LFYVVIRSLPRKLLCGPKRYIEYTYINKILGNAATSHVKSIISCLSLSHHHRCLVLEIADHRRRHLVELLRWGSPQK
jgi:hypothetical protein